MRSTTEEPYVKMRFDTLVDAKLHYNALAPRLGFSIKSNASSRFAYTYIFGKAKVLLQQIHNRIADDVVKFLQLKTLF